MIHDLSLAMAMNRFSRTQEFVVSQRVLVQLLSLPDRGGLKVQFNMQQESLEYRFMTRFQWRDLIFIHLSREPVILSSGLTRAS